MKIQVGHPVELPCVVIGVPEPTLTWTKNGRSYPVSPDGSLALNNVGLEDEGTYTCTATNIAGRDEARVRVLVQGWCQSKMFSKSYVSVLFDYANLESCRCFVSVLKCVFVFVYAFVHS